MTEAAGHELAALVGSWRLKSCCVIWTETQERADLYGSNPVGFMVLAATGRVMFLFTRSGRASAATEAERAALFAGMTAYTGMVRPGGQGRFVTSVDLAWDPAFGPEQVRFFECAGDELCIRTPEQSHPSYPDRRMVAELIWLREDSIGLSR